MTKHHHRQKHGSCLQESPCWLTWKSVITLHVTPVRVDVCRKFFGNLGHGEVWSACGESKASSELTFQGKFRGVSRTIRVWVVDVLLPLTLNVTEWVKQTLGLSHNFVCICLLICQNGIINKTKVTDASSTHRTDAIIKANHVSENVLSTLWQCTCKRLD